MDLVETWRNVLGELQLTLSKANFETWFKNTFIFEYKKNIFTIGLPSFFVENWIKDKYSKQILKALQNYSDEPVEGLKYKIATPKPEQVISFDKSRVIHKPVDKLETKSDGFIPQSLAKSSTLKANYTFQSFVVGPSNQLAHAASKAVAERKTIHYNPLYIYGDSGLGKTHLMQAIGNEFLKLFPDKNVIYVTTETFLNDFIQSVGAGFGRAKDFKNRYRNVDMLLIDDIQFLSSKEQTQDEFFHTFNHLYQNQKQVVLASDRAPKDIKGLEVRLKTRFEGGMVCDVTQPDLETREAILRRKVDGFGKKIDAPIISFIAANVKSSVRELEGALNKIVATSELTGEEITLERTRKILDNIVEETRQIITPELIIKEVHKYFDIAIEDLLGPKRLKEFIAPRQITMYLLKHECKLSFPMIGRIIGGKDHSTIMHGVKKIESSLSTDNQLKEDINFIKNKIYAFFR